MNIQDPHLIPWGKLVIPQTVNFTLFMGLLVYLLRKPLAEHFAGKNEEFEKNKAKAEEAKLLAERRNLEIKAQIKALEENANQDLKNARQEAKNIYEKILAEAKLQAVKLEKDADQMVQHELVRAKATLRLELIQKSTQMASDELKKNIRIEAQEALNEEFINNMKAALR